MFPNLDPAIVQSKLHKSPPSLRARSMRFFSSKYIFLLVLVVLLGLVTRSDTLSLLASNMEGVRSTATSTKSGVLTRSISEHDVETGFTQSITVTPQSPIFTHKSPYQYIEVHESPHFGRILVLDGVTQLTEKDAPSYNEMMAHMPLFQHSNPKRVLILGGGDGYILSEVLKHASVEHVDHVDLDGDVIEVCKNFFKWAQAWNDTRVHLHIQDGAKFVEEAPTGSYDIVIQDSSDPWTSDENGETVLLPSSSLYAPQHYSNIFRVLADGGILNFQAETMQIPSDFAGATEWRNSVLANGFRRVRYGTITIPTYPTGQIGFMLCEKSDKTDPPHNIGQRFRVMAASGMKTTYYHPRLQHSAFDLPLWAHEQMYGTLPF